MLNESRTYNANGQMTNLTSGSYHYAYNYSATQNNGRITSMQDVASGETITYAYDSLNRLISASGTGDLQGNWSQAYGADGKKLGVWQLTTPNNYHILTLVSTNVWFGGRLVQRSGVTTHEDRLQSIGKYFPYGEDRYNPTPANPSNDQEKFATYTRDSISGLDYARNRYYAAGMGRFMSADPYAGSANPQNPPSWNKYMYSGNDPVNLFDPSGLDPFSFPCTVGAGEHIEVTDCEIYTFYAFGFLPLDPPADRPPPIQIGRKWGTDNQGNSTAVTTAAQAHNVLKSELKNLSSNCQKVLPRSATLVAASLAVVYWDARPSDYGLITISDAIPGYKWSGTFQEIVGTSNAVDLLNGAEKPSQNIALGFAFFNESPAHQGLTLLHELLHDVTGLTDPDFDKSYKIVPQNGDSYSSALSAWLSNDCKN